MAQINGTVSKIVVDVLDKVTDPADLDGVAVTATMYVWDAMNTPYPGLPIDLGSTDLDGLNTTVAHSASDLYTLATTGSLP